MSAELLPCPFCKAGLFRYREGESASVAGRHPRNGCLIQNVVVLYGQEDRWNKRVTPSVQGGNEERQKKEE